MLLVPTYGNIDEISLIQKIVGGTSGKRDFDRNEGESYVRNRLAGVGVFLVAVEGEPDVDVCRRVAVYAADGCRR